jgi:peptide/nickel transport system substrate-binding protein
VSVNAAVGGVVNPSDATGGTLWMARTDDFDSLDPGNTYYAYVWNFLRFVGRTLVTFRPAPGAAGRELVGDLAAGLGETTDGGRTWTYRLRPGLSFADGTPVTAHDVKHAIWRGNYLLSGGPTYLRQFLGPDPDAIEVPDGRRIVFHLREPFAGFDHLATLPCTVPVPRGREPGAGGRDWPVATGPYRVAEYRRGEQLTLVRNPAWRQATDPVRRQLVDRVVVELGLDGQAVDERLLGGVTHVDLAGMGVQPATVPAVLADPTHADNPLIGFTWMFAINPAVAPFGDIHCRRAVQYAVDKAAMQEAYGGPVGGDVATTILPPTVAGYQPFDLYPGGPGHRGDLAAARAELAAAGLPDGFPARIAARSDRLKEYAAAQALAASLARVGITAEVVPFRSGDYFDKYAGVPAFLRANGIGLVMFGWGADFPDGFGFLAQIVDGRAIKPTGNHNFAEVDLPGVNTLLDEGARTLDPVARSALWARIDRMVMREASICPYLYAKSLLYRSPRLTNVHVSLAYGMYDYVALGVQEEGPRYG